MHVHVYVLYYEKGGKGSILVRIHILFLKGADVIDFTIHCFSPHHHEKYDFMEMFLMTDVRSVGEPLVGTQ